MNKIDRQEEAKILTRQEIEQLFNWGFQNDRDRVLFGVCLYAACKIGEACSMLAVDAYDRDRVRSPLLIRKSNSEGENTARSIPTHPHLVKLLDAYRSQSGKIYLFPGRHGRGHINPRAAALILKQACERVGLTGVSTHSFRRTALTSLSSTGIALQTLQAISGLESVAALQKYLNKREVQLSDAIASLKF